MHEASDIISRDFVDLAIKKHWTELLGDTKQDTADDGDTKGYSIFMHCLNLVVGHIDDLRMLSLHGHENLAVRHIGRTYKQLRVTQRF